jgi:hypothetical protein
MGESTITSGKFVGFTQKEEVNLDATLASGLF